MEGAQGSHSQTIVDKYGDRIVEGVTAEGYSFEEGQEKTTLKLGIKFRENDYSWVRFKDISLVRGKDMGFEVVVGEIEL